MKRYAVPLLLLLSFGVNIGLVWSRVGGDDRPGDGRQALAVFDEASPERPIPPRLIRMLERMAGDLSLDGEKQEQFLERQRQFFSRSIGLREQTRRAQQALRRELLSEAPNQERAEELLRLASESQAAIELEFVDNFFETRELLETPDQLKKFRRFMVRVRQLRQEMERRLDDRRGQRFESREDRRKRRLQERRDRGARPRAESLSESPPSESPPSESPSGSGSPRR